MQEECYHNNHKTKLSHEQDLVITPDEVCEVFKTLNTNKSPGPDGIPSKLLKGLLGNNFFIDSVAKFFTFCLNCEKIPSIWKIAYVIPIHKGGSLHCAQNYRPISLTCVLCKLYEKIIRDRILFQILNKISEHQHGFCFGKSCTSNLLESLDTIYSILSTEGECDVIYLDFSKAFDSVPHQRLLIKMANMGISDKYVNIVSNFLRKRQIRVKIGDVLSEPKEVLSGVPQGSVLGPLLFLIYVNDIPSMLRSVSKMFADDIKIIVNPNQYTDIEHDLHSLEYWQETWLLRLNTSKCKTVHFSSAKLPQRSGNDYCIFQQPLEKLETCKDLGVVCDSKLNFQNHINLVVSKAKKTLLWLLRTLTSREKFVIMKVYTTLVRPHLEYCTQVWAPLPEHGSWGTILNIESIQRLATKSISGLKDLSYNARLNELQLTTLLERRMRGDLIETFKIVNGFTDYGRDWFTLSSRTNHLILRSNFPSVNFFANRVVKYYNRLPLHVRNASSVTTFKKHLDKFRKVNFHKITHGQYWELSYKIFERI